MCCYITNFETPNQFQKDGTKKQTLQLFLRMVIQEEAYTLSTAYLVFKKTYILRIYECLNMTFLLFLTPL